VIVLLPVLWAVASPVLLMVATFVEDDFHVTDEVRSLLVLSPNVPVAVNCCVALSWMVGFDGVIEIATSVLAEGKNLPHPAARITERTTRKMLRR